MFDAHSSSRRFTRGLVLTVLLWPVLSLGGAVPAPFQIGAVGLF